MRKGNVRSCGSQFLKKHVTPKGWDVKGGIPQNACWRLGCGEARQTLKHDRAIPKTTAVQGYERNAMKLSVKALRFVWRAAGSEHHMSSTRRVFTYVVGRRVGMNDTCCFTLDMKKLDIPPHPTPTQKNAPWMRKKKKKSKYLW